MYAAIFLATTIILGTGYIYYRLNRISRMLDNMIEDLRKTLEEEVR
jgi:hypothetical protein